jgi:hypothetical protein
MPHFFYILNAYPLITVRYVAPLRFPIRHRYINAENTSSTKQVLCRTRQAISTAILI